MTPAEHEGGRRSGGVRTFLIADIRGYTGFTAQHGDEAASQLARKFAEVAEEGIEAWDGELVELRGDEALAVFESARQALRCAVELQDAFADETSRWPALPLSVGIGLDAGEAVAVGNGYRGAALNLAARLCALAKGGEVIASANLEHLAGPVPGLTFQTVPETQFKGIAQPVSAVQVADTQAAVHGPRPDHRTDGDLPAVIPILPPELEPIVPLVGRSRELRWLRWHWRRASHGHGRTVILSGPPGIGKTRLSAELATIAHAAGSPVQYFPTGRGADAEGLLNDAGASMLLVVDDLDAADGQLLRAVADVAKRTTQAACLLVVTHREEASTSLLAVVETLAMPDRRRALGPLASEAVRAIAAVYAGRAVDALPLRDILEESGGVPAAVHRVAAHWARSTTTRRLGASAGLTESGRRSLRQAEDSLIGDVAELEFIRERTGRLERDQQDPDGHPVAMICPYKGLAAYDAVDADYYFGRERLVAELVARLVGNSFLGLVGASGSGKSSVLRAGLLPALAGGVLPGSERWLQALIRPGEHPLAELAQGLARAHPDRDAGPMDAEATLASLLERLSAGQELLVAVDQFEETFGATRDESERAAFIDLLTKGRSGLRVVVTIRADHYGHCAAYPNLARLMGASHILVGPLTSTELEAVIEAPAQRVGLRVEPGLVQELIADAGTEPGVLPLLSTSLLELWQARESGHLTLAAYRLGGGLRGSVARLAEAAYAELNPAEAAIARSVFLRLAGPGEGEGVVRRRVSLAELDVDRDRAVAQVLETLTGARLLTTGDGFVEVAHEALLREWPRLQRWLEDDAAGRRVRLHLISAVQDWEQRGREPADLYRGARLSGALDWAAEHQIELNMAERQFLDESRLASVREVERERRTNRRLRGLLSGVGLLLVVAIGAGALALNQANAAGEQTALAKQQEADALAARGQAETAQGQAEAARQQAETDRQQAETARADAEKARADAETAARFARSRELAASSTAMLEKDPTLSKLLALSAAQLVSDKVDTDIESALHQSWSADAIVNRYVWPTDKPLGELWTDIFPDGKLMLASGGYGYPRDELEVVDLATNRIIWRYSPPWAPASVGPAYFSADGSRVIAGVLWEPNEQQKGQQAPPNALGVFAWDARTGRLLDRFDTGPCGALILSISKSAALSSAVPEGPDSTPDCYSGDYEAALETVDLASGPRKILAPHSFNDGVLSRDGHYAAFTDTEDGVKATVINLATGKRALGFDAFSLGQQDAVTRALSPDGSLLLYGDRPMKVLDVKTGAVVATLPASGGESYNAEFGPTGSTLYTSGRDATLRVFDGSNGSELFVAPAAGSGHASASLDGRVLVADRSKKTATLVDPRARGELGTIATCAGFAPAGTLGVVGDIAAFKVSCGTETTARTFVVDLASQKVAANVPGSVGQSQALSPDGTRILRQDGTTQGASGPLRVYDSRSGQALVDLEGMCTWTYPRDSAPGCKPFPEMPFTLANFSLAWSPDERFVAAIDDDDGFMAAWDARSGKLLKAQSGLPFFWDLTFTPDSSELIVSSTDPELIAFSTQTWEITRRNKLDASVDGAGTLGLPGFLADGQTLVGVGGFQGQGGGSLHLIDLATLTVRQSHRADEGSPKSMAISADGSLVAIGASDGLVRVWDGATGTLLHELKVNGQAQGVAFYGNDRLVVTPQDGAALIMSIDPQELVTAVGSSLTRGFTVDECSRFNFGTSCPTLEELRGSSP